MSPGSPQGPEEAPGGLAPGAEGPEVAKAPPGSAGGRLSVFGRVARFNRAIGTEIPGRPSLPSDESAVNLLDFLDEERGELASALVDGDLVGACDALADIVVFALGGFCRLGVDGDAVLDEVMRSNETKLSGRSGRARVDAVKGEGYSPPDITGILLTRGSLVIAREDESRPFNAEDSRTAMVKALELVDATYYRRTDASRPTVSEEAACVVAVRSAIDLAAREG